MANVVKNYGLKALYRRGGGAIPTEMHVALSAAAALGVGDPVIYAGDGNISGLASIDIAIGTEGSPSVNIIGVVQGIEATGPGSLATHGGATGSERKVMVALALPDVVFQVNAGNNAGLNSVDIGSNFDLVLGAVDAATGRSTWSLDDASTSTTTANQVRLIGFVDRPDNEQAATGTDTDNIACKVVFLESGVVGLPGVGI